MKKIFIGLFVVVILALIVYIFLPKSSKPKVLKIAKVFRGEITAFVEETGIVKPQVGSLIKIGTRATGLLTYLPYQVGDYVKKGELLALIDDREILADLNSAKATLKSLQAQLQLIDATYPLQIKEQEAKVRAAKARYDYAVINLSREEVLLKQEFTTQDSVDQAKKQRDVDWADYQVTLEALNRLKAEYKQKHQTLLAEITAQKERIISLDVELSYTKIYAPIDGYVSQVSTQQGETVVAGLSAPNLITLIDPTKLEVWLYVDETDVGIVSPGKEVLYYVDAYPDKWFHGKILTIYPEPEVKESIVYYLAIVKVPSADVRFIRPEMTVHARIITQKKQDVLLIPNAALKFKAGNPVVYRVKNKKIVPIKVKIGLKGENEIEIVSGLKEGEKVALEFVLPR
jgi:multidrug efflux pump subunit AcrA (membrane-fusion protein)